MTPGDGFLVKLSSTGAHIWSTFLMGSGDAIAVAESGVYVTGATGPSGWVSGGFDTSYNGGLADAYVIKLSGAGAHVWSTYLGGGGADEGRASEPRARDYEGPPGAHQG